MSLRCLASLVFLIPLFPQVLAQNNYTSAESTSYTTTEIDSSTSTTTPYPLPPLPAESITKMKEALVNPKHFDVMYEHLSYNWTTQKVLETWVNKSKDPRWKENDAYVRQVVMELKKIMTIDPNDAKKLLGDRCLRDSDTVAIKFLDEFELAFVRLLPRVLSANEEIKRVKSAVHERQILKNNLNVHGDVFEVFKMLEIKFSRLDKTDQDVITTCGGPLGQFFDVGAKMHKFLKDNMMYKWNKTNQTAVDEPEKEE